MAQRIGNMMKYRLVKEVIMMFFGIILLIGLSPLLSAGTVHAESDTADAPVSTISNMHLEGYVKAKVEGHIDAWALDALEKNPNLIGAVALASTGELGIENSPYTGLWADQCEYLGKHLTGMADLYQLAPSEALKQEGNDLVQQLYEARGEDGYLGIRRMSARLGPGTWDLWGHYHMIYGLLHWHQVVGNPLARQMAIEAGDYCIRHFASRPTYAIGSEFANYPICHAYALLYQETGNEKYLTEAKRVIEQDWPKHGNWLNNALQDKDFYTSDEPRWETLHSVQALTTLYEITKDPTYYQALEQIWWSILKTDRHNTGAFASYEKAVGHPYSNDGLETCACVGWAALSTDYLRLSRNAYVADELELTYYNTLLGALMDNMRQVTYNTPMNGYRISTQDDLNWAYNSGVPDFNCCQGNACRTLGVLAEWAALTDAKAIYLNYYGPCAIECKTPGGQTITLRIDGNYPVSGDIRISVEGLSQPEAFPLYLRIPSWSREHSVTFAGGTDSSMSAGTYHPLQSNWRNGDTIELHLGMTVHYWKGESLFGTKASIYYGPILLALDERHTDRNIHAVTIPMENAAAAQVMDGASDGCLLHVQVTDQSGKSITLVDFASAGKQRAAYATWLYVNGPLKVLSFDRDGLPVWQNGLD